MKNPIVYLVLSFICIAISMASLYFIFIQPTENFVPHFVTIIFSVSSLLLTKKYKRMIK